MYIKFLLLFFMLISTLSSQIINTISIPENGPISMKNFPMQYYIDVDNNITLKQIQEKRFLKTNSRTSLGYQKQKTVWFRFNIQNPSEENKELFIYHREGYTFINLLFYQLKNKTLIHKEDLSRIVPVKQRRVPDASPTLKLTLNPGETTTIYIKNQSLSSMMTNVQILDRRSYDWGHLVRNTLYGFLFGILLSLALYNAILFLTIKHSEYIFYVIFIVASIAYQLYLSGMPLEFLNLDHLQFKNLLFGVSILQIALFFFTQKVLETKVSLPKVHKVINFLIIFPLFIFVYGLFFGIDTILSLQAALAMISAIALLIIGFIALKYKVVVAPYYLVSIGLYLLFAIIGILTYFAVLPYNNLTRNALHLASLSEGFMLSLLLAYRIRVLRYRVLTSEKNLYDEIHSRNELLNAQVEDRTKELNTLNENLESKITLAVSEIRKKDEDLLRQNRMAMMGEMLSMIAHQWRQPLATIMSVKSNMEIQIYLGEMDEKELLTQLNDIDAYVQYMSKTVDDFSDFFKPNKKKEYFILAELVDASLYMMKTSYDNHNITVSTDYDTTKEIFSFKNELLQVFLNILKNAQDHFSEKRLAEPHMKISIKEFSDRQEISFEDNGGGIPESIINNIFDPYFSSKEEKNGTGLGLYMSRTIVKEHCKGNIDVVNRNKGAIFTITLYLDKEEDHEGV